MLRFATSRMPQLIRRTQGYPHLPFHPSSHQDDQKSRTRKLLYRPPRSLLDRQEELHCRRPTISPTLIHGVVLAASKTRAPASHRRNPTELLATSSTHRPRAPRAPSPRRNTRPPQPSPEFQTIQLQRRATTAGAFMTARRAVASATRT